MDILINANEDISEDDVEIIDAKKHAAREAQERPAPEKTPKRSRTSSGHAGNKSIATGMPINIDDLVKF